MVRIEAGLALFKSKSRVFQVLTRAALRRSANARGIVVYSAL